MAWITWMATLRYMDYYEEKSSVYCSAMALPGLSQAESSPFPGSTENEIWKTLCYGSNNAYEAVSYTHLAGRKIMGTEFSFRSARQTEKPSSWIS